MRKSFEEELQELNTELIEMSTLAKDSIEKATKCLFELDTKIIEKVKENDKKLYEKYISIEKMCFDLLALQSPVAKDLRLIVTALKICYDLDRIGRYALDITEAVKKFGEKKHFKKLVTIPYMANLTIEMVDLAIESFVKRDTSLVESIFEKEDSVDSLFDEVFREVGTHMIEDKEKVAIGIQYILIARILERIADHCCLIAEGIIYMVRGERVIHK